MDSQHPQRRRPAEGKGDPLPAPRPAHAPAAAGSLALGVSELSQLALWMAATLAGMVTAVLARRAPFFRSLLRKLGTARGARRHKPSREQSLPMLAEAIVGHSKVAVASVFGPPRSATMAGPPAMGMGETSYWQADTWYYPLPAAGRLALAIEFADDSAHRVEFLRAA